MGYNSEWRAFVFLQLTDINFKIGKVTDTAQVGNNSSNHTKETKLTNGIHFKYCLLGLKEKKCSYNCDLYFSFLNYQS